MGPHQINFFVTPKIEHTGTFGAFMVRFSALLASFASVYQVYSSPNDVISL